jgi:hypothetical protein
MVALQAASASPMGNFVHTESIGCQLHSNTKLELGVEKLKPWVAVERHK